MANSVSIGLIGLGLLGTAIGDRLLDAGYRVVGYDLDDQRRNAFANRGGVSAAATGDVFTACDILVLSLPTGEIAARLINDHHSSMRPAQIIIDTTTGRPQDVLAIAAKLSALGASYIEATVGGSSAQLAQGQALLFVAGQTEIVERVDIAEVLNQLSDNVHYLGATGMASRFKLVHNLILGLNRAVLAEGLCFAEALGIPPITALKILQGSAAASAVMQTKGQKMVSGDFTPQARLSQHLKDVRIITQEAVDAKVATPLSQLHCQLLELAEQLGHGSSDNSAIIEAIRNWRE